MKNKKKKPQAANRRPPKKNKKMKSRPATARFSVSKQKHFQKTLSDKRDDILRLVKEKEGAFTTGEVGDEADAASQTFEREMMFEMTNGERIVLDDIEAGLRKIEKGEYGICESCHKKITSQRLRIVPWARYCIGCQTRNESPAGT